MSEATTPPNGQLPTGFQHDNAPDAGKTVLVGVLGGLLSAAGYLVYQRLPDEQKDRLHRQVRGLIESRINELRDNFKF